MALNCFISSTPVTPLEMSASRSEVGRSLHPGGGGGVQPSCTHVANGGGYGSMGVAMLAVMSNFKQSSSIYRNFEKENSKSFICVFLLLSCPSIHEDPYIVHC